MRKTERLHAIARQLAICKNCYSINHHSLFKVRNAECLNHQRGLIVTAGLVRQLFLDTQQTFVCCWCYYITYDCMCQHLFLKLFAISILTAQQGLWSRCCCISIAWRKYNIVLHKIQVGILHNLTQDILYILHKSHNCTLFYFALYRKNISKIQK